MKRSLQRMCSAVMKQVGAGCLKTAFIAVVVGQAACLSWAGNGTWTNTASGGLLYDTATQMVNNPFLVTTSLINGQYECTFPGDTTNSQMVQSAKRTKMFVTLLGKFGATLSTDENSLCPGGTCVGCNLKAGDVFGTNPLMQDINRMFIDFSQTSCPAVSYGIALPLSFYYDGILELCKNMNK